ncbi:hypothetical protein [Micromonospora sicca]|uniref:hypothetical protein n=1 Tax=Micromonospora sicca TaxID=2202420 RepID=UPI001374B4B5|nr:hypothetical protein [Micromonospora sp. 4G51]
MRKLVLILVAIGVDPYADCEPDPGAFLGLAAFTTLDRFDVVDDVLLGGAAPLDGFG